MMYPGPESPLPFADDHSGTERPILGSGIPYTFLRNSAHQENLKLDLNVIETGVVRSAAGDGRASYVSIADAALAAAGAVERDIPGIFDLTGPESHSTSALIGNVAESSNHSVKVLAITESQLTDHQTNVCLPQDIARRVMMFDRVKRSNLSVQITNNGKILSAMIRNRLPQCWLGHHLQPLRSHCVRLGRDTALSRMAASNLMAIT